MPRPVGASEILLGPGRAGWTSSSTSPASPTATCELRQRAGAGGPRKLGSRPYVGPLMQFRVGRAGRGPHAGCPPSCGRCPRGSADAPREAAHELGGHGRDGLSPSWLINGRTFDPGSPTTAQARHGRDVAARQPDRGRPHDAHPRHRLVPARAQRQAAAAVGGLPEGDVLRSTPAKLLVAGRFSRLHRQVRRCTATCSTTRTTG